MTLRKLLLIVVPLLAVCVMGSALYLVNVRYDSRALFLKSERLQLQAEEFDVAWRQLQSERAELARNARIDRKARNELDLSVADIGRTMYIQGKPSALGLQEQP